MAYASETCVIVIRSTENRTEGSLAKFLGQLGKKIFHIDKVLWRLGHPQHHR